MIISSLGNTARSVMESAQGILQAIFEGLSEKAFLQAAVTGVIAYSIPILWDTYNRIRETQQRIRAKNPVEILERGTNFRIKSALYKQIIMPSIAAAVLGVTVLPLLPPPINVAAVGLVILLFAMLPLLIERIYKKHDVGPLQRLTSIPYDQEELLKFFSAIWKETPEYLVEEFELNDGALFDIYQKKLNEAARGNDFAKMNELLQPLVPRLEGRHYDYFAEKLLADALEYKYLAYRVRHDDSLGAGTAPLDRTAALYVNAACRSILLTLQKLMLEGGSAAIYYEILEKALNDESRKGFAHQYVVTQLGDQLLKLNSEEDKYSDCWYYFPYRWRITEENFRESDDSLAYAFWDVFLRWAQPRIQKPNDKNGNELRKVTEVLLPELDPYYLAHILHILLTPGVTSGKFKTVLDTNPSFGFGSRVFSGSGFLEEESRRFEYMQKQRDKDIQRTLHFFINVLQYPQLSVEAIERYLIELNQDDDSEPTRERKKKEWKDFLEKISAYHRTVTQKG